MVTTGPNSVPPSMTLLRCVGPLRLFKSISISKPHQFHWQSGNWAKRKKFEIGSGR
jgi:hypothetical protein